MNGMCERVVRCLCFCFIKKQTVPFVEAAEEHSKFLPSQEFQEADHNNIPKREALKDKISDYLAEDKKKKETLNSNISAKYRNLK